MADEEIFQEFQDFLAQRRITLQRRFSRAPQGSPQVFGGP